MLQQGWRVEYSAASDSYTGFFLYKWLSYFFSPNAQPPQEKLFDL